MIIDAHTNLGQNNNRHYSVDELLASMKGANIDYSLVITDRHDEYSMMPSVINFSEEHPKIIVIGDISYQDFRLQAQMVCWNDGIEEHSF